MNERGGRGAKIDTEKLITQRQSEYAMEKVGSRVGGERISGILFGMCSTMPNVGASGSKTQQMEAQEGIRVVRAEAGTVICMVR